MILSLTTLKPTETLRGIWYCPFEASNASIWTFCTWCLKLRLCSFFLFGEKGTDGVADLLATWFFWLWVFDVTGCSQVASSYDHIEHGWRPDISTYTYAIIIPSFPKLSAALCLTCSGWFGLLEITGGHEWLSSPLANQIQTGHCHLISARVEPLMSNYHICVNPTLRSRNGQHLISHLAPNHSKPRFA